jgi:hypothetical protein
MANSERTVGPHGEALTPVSPIPPDQLPKIRELIRRHGRDVVIELLREQGYDTQGYSRRACRQFKLAEAQLAADDGERMRSHR